MDEVAGIELVGELGRGAQSVVYRGRRDGRDYAVKVMISANDVEGAAGFRREAALLACLDAASVARIYEVGEVGGRPYLIMDLVTGRSLADTIAGGRLDVDRAVELGRQVAVALDAAHRAGVVHRDVKPQNIMIRPDSSACLIDFGLAGRTGRDVTDTAVGTFAYSAPEQVGTLRRAVDGRADLYALGIVLFECLTGELPFTGADAGELIHRHLSTPAPAVASLRPDCPPALAAIVAKLLHKDPDDRYQHAAGLVDDLGRVGGPWPFPLDAGRSTGTDTALVGRSSELADLLSHWSEAQAGRGGMVVLSGPPGVGKSRLVRELAATLRAGGAAVLHGGFRADAVPLQPLREAIAAYVRGRGSTGETALHAAAGGTS
ncbi:MAG TPA: serine/threonine-protein kinase, partial [Rugosimonospora sp.]|nr:serine/threonine-protein kinase [Rugosimonospora sp.]